MAMSLIPYRTQLRELSCSGYSTNKNNRLSSSESGHSHRIVTQKDNCALDSKVELTAEWSVGGQCVH